MNTEEKLRDQIQQASKDGQFKLAKELMEELIEIQKEVVVPEVDKKMLVKYGISMLILDQELEVREKIKQAQQDGDFIKAQELTREIIKLQKKQPQNRSAVRMYE